MPHLAERTASSQILLSLRINLIVIISIVEAVEDGVPPPRQHVGSMNPTESTQFLLLDNDWRPLRRVTADDGWHCVVHELLKLDSQWLIIEQQRFDDKAPVPRWDDIHLSRAISRRLRPTDVKLADHVIRGSGDQFSFRAAGLL